MFRSTVWNTAEGGINFFTDQMEGIYFFMELKGRRAINAFLPPPPQKCSSPPPIAVGNRYIFCPLRAVR